MTPIDPTDRDLAKKRAREAAQIDLAGLEDPEPWEFRAGFSHSHMPSLDFYDNLRTGYPADPVSAAFEELYAQTEDPCAWDEVDADE